MHNAFYSESHSKNSDWWSEDTIVRFQNINFEGGEPWLDVEANISKMDLLYEATFRSWLKDEENVSIVSSYLHRIANEYPLDRIVNALKWLIQSWSVESVAILIKHVTADWTNVKQEADFKASSSSNYQTSKHLKIIEGETKRGFLIREITRDWSCVQVAKLVSNLSTTFWENRLYQEYFLRCLVLDYDFCHLSEFFSYVGSQLGLDYRLKVSMLQLSARRNSKTVSSTKDSFKSVQKRVIQDVENDTTKRARINTEMPCFELEPSVVSIQGLHCLPSDQPSDQASTDLISQSSQLDSAAILNFQP
ncbi:hypothetical protein BB560_004572 [Smittium megazygosporum]|uniref:Uncharacterized protein n=1 Tax=Smittium megazygosporum TaxID=133381 RepID=A0A2T9Z8U6_9FUNG|nr:hypothetical protein BB560_004572 [Smittium megazygosporum]